MCYDIVFTSIRCLSTSGSFCNQCTVISVSILALGILVDITDVWKYTYLSIHLSYENVHGQSRRNFPCI